MSSFRYKYIVLIDYFNLLIFVNIPEGWPYLPASGQQATGWLLVL
jgi:hypothetical protein